MDAPEPQVALPEGWPFERRPEPLHVWAQEVSVPGLEGRWQGHVDPTLAWTDAPESLGGAFGRGGVFRLASVVVRPYRRGGWLGKVNARRYLGPGRFAWEWHHHRCLWMAGFPTVEPLGYLARPMSWGWEGLYLTRFDAALRPWPRDWGGPERVRQVLALVDWLCAWGLWVPDLNATNVMVDASGGLKVLDWDRARWDSSPDLRRRYIQRLARSLAKLGAPMDLRNVLEQGGL